MGPAGSSWSILGRMQSWFSVPEHEVGLAGGAAFDALPTSSSRMTSAHRAMSCTLEQTVTFHEKHQSSEQFTVHLMNI